MIENISSLPTNEIIHHARCEMRAAFLEWLVDRKLVHEYEPAKDLAAKLDAISKRLEALDKENTRRRAHRQKQIKLDKWLTKEQITIKKFSEAAVSYDVDFNITEHNYSDGALGFKMPFTVAPAALDLTASGSLHLKRQGERAFKASEKWASLAANDTCDTLNRRSPNIVYPITGELGAKKLFTAFIGLAEQSIPKDSFVETLIFTTEIGATASAGLKLNAEPHAFRLINASLGLDGGRQDIHKMVISLAFPVSVGPNPFPSVTRADGDLEAPFQRSPEWRARYNLCVADARAREDSHNSLRLEAPELYCIKYADYFINESPRNGPGREPIVVQVVAPSGSAATDRARGQTGGEPRSPGSQEGRTTIQRSPASEKRLNSYQY